LAIRFERGGGLIEQTIVGKRQRFQPMSGAAAGSAKIRAIVSGVVCTRGCPTLTLNGSAASAGRTVAPSTNTNQATGAKRCDINPPVNAP